MALSPLELTPLNTAGTINWYRNPYRKGANGEDRASVTRVITNARSLSRRHVQVWMTGDASAQGGLRARPQTNDVILNAYPSSSLLRAWRFPIDYAAAGLFSCPASITSRLVDCFRSSTMTIFAAR